MKTSINVKFRQSTIANKKGTIYYQIIHNRTVHQFTTHYKIFPTEWNFKQSAITITNNSERKDLLKYIRTQIYCDIKRFIAISNKLEANGTPFTCDDLINEYKRYTCEYSLFNFMENIIAKLKENGRIRTSETYRATLNSFKHFRKEENIMLDCITSEIIESYEAWLHNRGLIPNSTSFYNRILRAVYNRAVEQGIIENRKPFKHVYTGIDKTVKRALSLNEMKCIKKLDLTNKPTLELTRDLFLFSFYTRGMSFIDMAYLKKKDLSNGILSYRRKKTGQIIFIKWEKSMQEIINRYNTKGSVYLLPIISSTGNERENYRNALRFVNNKLKIIATMAGLSTHLTMYVSRHSWASIAKSKNIPISIISEGLGHNSESTTQIYLTSLDNSTIDTANKIILKGL